MSYDTPSKQLLSQLSPKLPPVTQGRKFLPLHDDTIDSGNDDSFVLITPAKQKSLQSHKPICQPIDNGDSGEADETNDVKPLPNETSSSGDNKDVPVTHALHSTKKRSLSIDKGPNKRKLLETPPATSSSADCSNVISCDTSRVISPAVGIPSTYSELKYLEAIGIMRTIKQPKHRGISVAAGGSGAPTIYSSPDQHNDRMTKIKISYRVRKTDGDVQFALIVYEQVTRNPVTRRNLMTDFNETTLPAKPNRSGKKRKKTPVLEREVHPTLRRLRF